MTLPGGQGICRLAIRTSRYALPLYLDAVRRTGDIPLLRRAGLGVAVQNARQEVKSVADYVTITPGGQGALREVIELIMQARGEWTSILQKYGLDG